MYLPSATIGGGKVFRAGKCRATSPKAWRIRFFFTRQDGFTGRDRNLPLHTRRMNTSQEGRVPWLPYNRHDDTTPPSPSFSKNIYIYIYIYVLITFNRKVDSFPASTLETFLNLLNRVLLLLLRQFSKRLSFRPATHLFIQHREQERFIIRQIFNDIYFLTGRINKYRKNGMKAKFGHVSC